MIRINSLFIYILTSLSVSGKNLSYKEVNLPPSPTPRSLAMGGTHQRRGEQYTPQPRKKGPSLFGAIHSFEPDYPIPLLAGWMVEERDSPQWLPTFVDIGISYEFKKYIVLAGLGVNTTLYDENPKRVFLTLGLSRDALSLFYGSHLNLTALLPNGHAITSSLFIEKEISLGIVGIEIRNIPLMLSDGFPKDKLKVNYDLQLKYRGIFPTSKVKGVAEIRIEAHDLLIQDKSLKKGEQLHLGVEFRPKIDMDNLTLSLRGGIKHNRSTLGLEIGIYKIKISAFTFVGSNGPFIRQRKSSVGIELEI